MEKQPNKKRISGIDKDKERGIIMRYLKVILLIAICALCLLMPSTAATGSIIWDYSPLTTGGSGVVGYLNMTDSQNFVDQIIFNSEAILSGMDIYSDTSKGSVGDTATIRIFDSDASGRPNTLIHSFTETITVIDTEGATPGNNRKHVDFTNPITLQANTTYWIGMSGRANIAQMGLSINPPGDGQMRKLVRASPGQSFTIGDMAFRLSGTFNCVPEPPTIPDDTMAPTGAVHARSNIIWPGNNRMVTVTLEGYVVDELSIARDGGGIGVSSAYLLIDGNEIILRDEDTDLLDEDGRFSVTIEVEAVNGAVINVELYGTDTEPEETGGPNSGLVDSTFILVPEDVPLLSPEDEVELYRKKPVAFEWDDESCSADKIEFSAYPDFSIALSFAIESGATSWTPDRKSWFKIKLLGIKGRKIYWRVIGTDPNGYIVQSEVFSFSFRRYCWWR